MEVFRGGGLDALDADAAVASAVRRLTDQEVPAVDGRSAVGASVLDGERLMTEAFEACAGAGDLSLSMTQLMMEVAVRGGDPAEFTPERVGRWLAASGFLAPGASATRRRLHGHISRLYELDRQSDQEAASMDPFAFCVSSRCTDCRYAGVCEAVAPGMMTSKMRSR